MRFSILLPTHNRGDVVGFAIESVLGQRHVGIYTNYWWWGDGCTDCTSDVVRGFAVRDTPRAVSLICRRGRGLGMEIEMRHYTGGEGELVAVYGV